MKMQGSLEGPKAKLYAVQMQTLKSSKLQSCSWPESDFICLRQDDDGNNNRINSCLKYVITFKYHKAVLLKNTGNTTGTT